jgi:hypothetical protein
MRVRTAILPLLAMIAVTFGLAGCAGGGGGSSDGTPRGSSNRIIEAELAAVQQLDVYTVIQRLRPAWLRSRSGADPVVIMDGTPQAGGLDALRTLRTSEFQEMRYMSASDATTRYGTGYDGGAILLVTKR